MSSVNKDFKNIPFRNKIVVFGGDFRQILPVVKNPHQSEIVSACINRSYFWPKVNILKLTINMRIKHDSFNSVENFSNLLLKVGEGKKTTIINRVKFKYFQIYFLK